MIYMYDICVYMYIYICIYVYIYICMYTHYHSLSIYSNMPKKNVMYVICKLCSYPSLAVAQKL